MESYCLPFLWLAVSLNTMPSSFIHIIACVRISFLFKKGFIYFFRERGREGEREGEKQQCARDTSIDCLLHAPAGDLVRSPAMCPGWESNQQPFGLQAGPQSIEPHQPGVNFFSFKGWIRFFCMYISHFVCPIICWWTFELFPIIGYGELYCCKHCCTSTVFV